MRKSKIEDYILNRVPIPTLQNVLPVGKCDFIVLVLQNEAGNNASQLWKIISWIDLLPEMCVKVNTF